LICKQAGNYHHTGTRSQPGTRVIHHPYLHRACKLKRWCWSDRKKNFSTRPACGARARHIREIPVDDLHGVPNRLSCWSGQAVWESCERTGLTRPLGRNRCRSEAVAPARRDTWMRRRISASHLSRPGPVESARHRWVLAALNTICRTILIHLATGIDSAPGRSLRTAVAQAAGLQPGRRRRSLTFAAPFEGGQARDAPCVDIDVHHHPPRRPPLQFSPQTRRRCARRRSSSDLNRRKQSGCLHARLLHGLLAGPDRCCFEAQSGSRRSWCA